MQVDVTLRGGLATRLPGGQARIDLPDQGTVEDLLVALELRPLSCVCVVNGAAVGRTAPLRPDDRVQVFAQTAGGA